MIERALGIVLPVVLGAGAAYAIFFIAVQHGRNLERAATLQRAVELVQERDKLNVEVRTATPADICRRLGGEWMPEDSECR